MQKGEPPGNCAEAVFRSTLKMPNAPQLPEEQVRYLVEKLYDGFFAFEALTDRDWDLGICGICGICPLFESGDGNCKNCTPVTNSMVNFSQHTYTQTSCSVYMIPFPLRWCGQFPARWMLSRVLWMLKSGGGMWTAK